MARPILTLASLTIALWPASRPLWGFAPHSAPETCSSAIAPGASAGTTADLLDLKQKSQSSPFYQELVRLEGKPLSCAVKLDDGTLSLSYSFRHRAQFVARVNRNIESSEQRLELRGMDPKRAIALLRQAEKYSYQPDGCGIMWDRSSEDTPGRAPGSREVVYRGDTCNCQARLVYKLNSVIALVLRSAC